MTECGHGLQCAGWVIAESIRDLPCVCRERREAFALASLRAGSWAVEAALDLAWVATQGAGWVRSRRRRIVAIAAAPLVPALTVLVLFSSQTVGGSALAAAPSPPRDAHPISAVDPVQGNVASRRHVVVRPETASRPARVRSGVGQTARPTRVAVAPTAVQQRSGKARVALRPAAAARVAAQRPRRSPPPRRGVPRAETPEPAPTVVPVAEAAPQAEQPPDQRRQPTEIQPAAPAALPAAAAPAELPPASTPPAEQAAPDATPPAPAPAPAEDGGEQSGGEKPKKEKEKKHDDKDKSKGKDD